MQAKTLIAVLTALALGQSGRAAELRELSTDRPDKTESAITVDKGHCQLEVDLLTADFVQDATGRSRSLSFGNFNLKAGLADNVDLQFGFEPVTSAHSEDLDGNNGVDQSGNGDIVVRLKVNLWGDNGGTGTNFGVMPFLKIPKASEGFGNGEIEGGLILPLGFDLGHGFDLGTMLEYDINQDSDGNGKHADTVISASLSHDLFGPIGAYLEYWGLATGESGQEGQQSIDGGLTWGIGANMQFDLGLNVGLLPAGQQDLNPFIGYSQRL